MTTSRKKFWILPAFQSRMLFRFGLVAILASFLTALAAYLILYQQDKTIAGDLFLVTKEFGSDPALLSRRGVALPALLVGAGISLVFALTVGLFYSHRLAGPVYRLRREIEELLHPPHKPIKLRTKDELQELAESLNTLSRQIHEEQPEEKKQAHG